MIRRKIIIIHLEKTFFELFLLILLENYFGFIPVLRIPIELYIPAHAVCLPIFQELDVQYLNVSFPLVETFWDQEMLQKIERLSWMFGVGNRQISPVLQCGCV